MSGHNPNCNNCFKCLSRNGSGHRRETRWFDGKIVYEQVTCPVCRGVGGKPGAGKHDHRRARRWRGRSIGYSAAGVGPSAAWSSHA